MGLRHPILAPRNCNTRRLPKHQSHMRDNSHSYVWHYLLRCVTWFIWVNTNIYVRQKTSIRVTWLIDACDMIHMSEYKHKEYTNVTTKQQSHMCDRSHSYVWHDLLICVTWFIWVNTNIRRILMWRPKNTVICATEDIHTCDITYWYVWKFKWMNTNIRSILMWRPNNTVICATEVIHTCDMTYWRVWHDSYEWIQT